MKHFLGCWPLMAGLSCAIFAASLALGQECRCQDGSDGWLGQGTAMPGEGLVANFAPGDTGELGPFNNVAACSGPFCGYACRSEGFFFAAEAFFAAALQPDRASLGSHLLELHTPAAPDLGDLEPSIDPTARISFGYQTCDGLGVRARFWGFENGVSKDVAQAVPADPNLAAFALELSVFDLEVLVSSMASQLCDTTLSAGYRFAEYEEGALLRRDDTQLASVRTRYVGNGLTGAVGLRRQLTGRLSVMANPRVSLLFGGQDLATSGVAVPPGPLGGSFDVRYTLESQFGASYEHAICGGGLWFARGGYEVQYWDDFVASLGGETGPASTWFSGAFFAIGLQR